LLLFPAEISSDPPRARWHGLDRLFVDRPERHRFPAGWVGVLYPYPPNADTYDRVQKDDVMQGAMIEAWFAYHAATRAEMLPRIE
jgi:hypothetical protein